MYKSIYISQYSYPYILTEYNEFECMHEYTELVACCNGENCWCAGGVQVVCENPDCTGIHSWQAEDIIEESWRLT